MTLPQYYKPRNLCGEEEMRDVLLEQLKEQQARGGDGKDLAWAALYAIRDFIIDNCSAAGEEPKEEIRQAMLHLATGSGN